MYTVKMIIVILFLDIKENAMLIIKNALAKWIFFSLTYHYKDILWEEFSWGLLFYLSFYFWQRQWIFSFDHNSTTGVLWPMKIWRHVTRDFDYITAFVIKLLLIYL